MKLANILQNNTMKVLAAVTLAGAMLTAAVPAAQAQRVVVGVGVGYRHFAPAPPVRFYGAPVYGGPVYRGPVYGGPVYGYGYHRDWDHHRGYWR
jgi:hypothetical protein